MLRIYPVAMEMIGRLAEVVEEVERRDRDLGRQMRRALASIGLNLAEGMGNTGGHKRERYQTALGSAREVRASIEVARAFRYVGQVDAAAVDQLEHVIATLIRLVRPA